MSTKRKETAVVYRQENISEGILDMWIVTELAKDAAPGQFISVYPKNQSMLLPRPVSICEVSADRTKLRIVYRVAGKGTTEFSGYSAGDEIEILGVLGNGFPLQKAEGKRALLVGGGIGLPPMLELAKQVSRLQGTKTQIVAGYRNRNLFLDTELTRYGELYIATEDGSVGSKGNVMNAIADNQLQADVVFACGPTPMLRAIKEFAAANNMEAYISLEERMACGVGACLGCVCRTKETDHHSNVHNARVCTDGPVFDAREVEFS